MTIADPNVIQNALPRIEDTSYVTSAEAGSNLRYTAVHALAGGIELAPRSICTVVVERRTP